MTAAKPKGTETKEDPTPTPEEVAVQEAAAADEAAEVDAAEVDAAEVDAADVEVEDVVEDDTDDPPAAPEPVTLDDNHDAETAVGRPRLVALRNAPTHDAEEVALPVGGQVASGDVWAEIIVAGALTPTFQLLAKEGVVVHPGDVAGLPARG